MPDSIIKNKLLILLVCTTAALLSISATFILKPKEYAVTSYGAVGNGETINTAAIQKTIDACSAAGGGVVVIPKGVFVTGDKEL